MACEFDALADLEELQIEKSLCWNYKVMGSQRRYLEGLIDDIDDADDEY